MSVPVIGPEVEERLDWLGVTEALSAGHQRPKAEIGDTFLYRGDDTMLSRSAWIDGMGIAVKTATIFPGNAAQGLANIGGSVSLFADTTGVLEAVIDFALVTKWKTAGDSLWASLRLARPDSRRVLILGAGTVARSLIDAYRAGFPGCEISVWNRTAAKAADLGVAVETDLEAAVARADIIATATMATDPVICGDWLRPGQHLDLIGAYRPDMREVDDTALRRARIFVDSRATTLGHIGELKIPLEAGVITEADVIADNYDGPFARQSEAEITIAKNGGGAHMDLMVSRYILERWQA